MLIKIIKCEADSIDPTRITWYHGLVGFRAEVELTGNGYYKIVEPFYVRGQYLEIDDCEDLQPVESIK